jgi:DNA-binding transcriptional ArsR family regulator
LEVALRLKALADPVRVKLMSLLLASVDGDTTGALAGLVALSEPTVSHHLSQLRTAGLIDSQRRGMNVVHSARREALAALCTVLDPNCCSPCS